MLLLYRTLLYLALPLLVVRFLWRGARNTDYFHRIGERIGILKSDPQMGGFWVHAVSVGEVNAAIPLVSTLRRTYPNRVVTLTTMTTTGSDRVRQVLGGEVQHYYLPYDYPGAVRRFLRKIDPCAGLIMETEIWPNMIHCCRRMQIPLIYTNVRMSQRSFEGYHRLRSLFTPLLRNIREFAVQSAADARRLEQLGVDSERVEITGSLKFDIQLNPSIVEIGQSIRRQVGAERPVLVVASTHEGEENEILTVFQSLLSELPDALLILVPRHPERFNTVQKLVEKQGLKLVRRTGMTGQVSEEIQVLLVDKMGELPNFISAGDVTFMGGSLTEIGGHNLLEPAALGKPVVFGPHMFNFAEISDMFLERGAGIQVNDSGELVEVFLKLFEDPGLRDRYGSAGEKLVAQNRGALDRVTRIVARVVPASSTE